VNKIFLDILIVLVAAKMAAEAAERLKIPAVVGEIVAGIAIGPSVFGLVKESEVLATFAELGVILLLFEVGMQMDLRELKAVGSAAMSVAVVGIVVPFAAGYPVAIAFGLSSDEALFAAAALTATSVGITARVFGDLKALATREARTVLGAAVADDVMGLIILTVVVRLVTGDGNLSVATVGGIIAVALLFLVVCTALGVAFAPCLFAGIERYARSSATLFALALAFALAIAELATLAKLAPIIGAFVAGLALGRSRPSARIQRELTPVGHLFIPVFFLAIGINVDVRAFGQGHVLALAGGLIVVAIVGKTIAGYAAFGMKVDRLQIGFGMIPRGEVGLIFASIGLAEGVLGEDPYAAILLMVLVTTLITPPLLSWRDRQQRAQHGIALEPADATVAPSGGWLRLLPGTGQGGRSEVELTATPAPSLAVQVALQAAPMLANADPGPQLVNYLRDAASQPEAVAVPWTQESTRHLVALLRTGTARSWRFLESTAVLDRSLPELDDVWRLRRQDPARLDSAHLHHWQLVDQVRGYLTVDGDSTVQQRRSQVAEARAAITHPDRLLLAAWILDATDEVGDRSASASALLERLQLDSTDAAVVGQLVAERSLLLAGAVRHDGLTEDSVTTLAAHLGSLEQAHSLYLLTLAGEQMEDWELLLVDQLHALVCTTLRHDPAVTKAVGSDSGLADGPVSSAPGGSLVDRRRTQAMTAAGPRNPINARIAIAPVGYLLSQPADAVVRQMQLIDPVPTKGRFRVSVTPGQAEGTFAVEVGGRDTIGLVAMVTGVLERFGLDVIDAVIATWGDKGALQVFQVRLQPGRAMATGDELRAAIEASNPKHLEAIGAPDAVVSFDDSASPWHTIVEVEGPDRPGLLHALAVAFAASHADMHSARVTTTVDGVARDRFDLTDRTGGKLDNEAKALITASVRNGVTAGSIRSRRLSLTAL
jgi:Kef-type K+ transport system membrane component KefB/predicted amino acid-binding ACT domain protein